MALKRVIREKVWLKYDKHCAYCGDVLRYESMQVDHVVPQRNFLMHVKNKWRLPIFLSHLTELDVDHIDNLMPACRVCNNWKSSHDLECFRSELLEQTKRLNLRSSNYRMAKKYGLLVEINTNIVFYFERN